ncbi:hypothetical protein [Clostridium sp. HV4-5-A1G]|uniref:hypothetical protein n=1 Tax=Clostridium sp. HV4-5-A1G TaxID=2004595 RepID=UPI0012389817|nr:hypothetical protein [Clostridium sp. HV4-5-A1G]KAA8667262.1 hypothetical protein F3O63_15885 [Clostridium sp. HV4-5-A1G]CAB1253927.1 conserved hypothetical protein [Clostridiaceae bacterium BL-3]
MYDFPNATIVYNTSKLEDLESKIKEIRTEHKKLNRRCEVEVIPKPNPQLITFDGYTNIRFELSIYIRHLSVN